MLAFWLTCKILVTSDAETHTLLLAGHKHDTIIDFEGVLWKRNCERKFAYLFVNDQWKLSRNKGKRVLKIYLKLIKSTHTFVKSRGVWVWLDWKDVYALLGEIQKNCHFREDDCHFTLYSFTNNDWSLRLLEKTWQQLFLWVINLCLGSYIICPVFASEIFLLQSDFSAITEVHNFSF